MAYSLDFRRKVLTVRDKEGLTIVQVAKRFDVGVASVTRWIKTIHRKPQGPRKRKIDLEALQQEIVNYPSAYQHERAARFGVSQSAIFRALKKLGATYKKTLIHPEANASKRLAFQGKITAYEATGRCFAYIDESGFEYDAPPTHGYTPLGQRCYGTHDWQAKGRTNAIGALIGKQLITVVLFETSINADVFHAWTVQDLLPKLPPHCAVVMDNATFHKRQDIQKAIQNAGHTLEYLPTYSPDLNPIEHKWAQAKALRKRCNPPVDELFRSYVL